MRFSAATTADRLLPERLALRARPLLGRIDAVLFSADERGEAGRMSLIAFAIRIVSAAIAFVSQVLLARWMGSFEYGIFVLVWVDDGDRRQRLLPRLPHLGHPLHPRISREGHAGRTARHPVDQPAVRARRLDG